MDMTNSPLTASIDAAGLAAALRSLGICHAADPALVEIAARANDEADAVRVFIRRERPHLLTCYDLEGLVGAVLATRAAGAESPASLDSYLPC
jgi:hypothetical protein